MNLLFAKFPWPKRDPVAALRTRLHDHCELRVFRALEADEGCVYAVPSAGQEEIRWIEDAMRDALATATTSRLALLMDLAGASAGEAAPYHYVVETDVLAEREADFNAWYDREHDVQSGFRAGLRHNGGEAVTSTPAPPLSYHSAPRRLKFIAVSRTLRRYLPLPVSIRPSPSARTRWRP